MDDTREHLEKDIHLSSGEQTGETEDISAEVLLVINALKHPDYSLQMSESKKMIYERFLQKTNNTPSSITKRKKTSFRFPAIAASVTIMLTILTGLFSYFGGRKSVNDQLANIYVETTAPKGTLSKIKLIDGSSVILNGGSRLVYPALFSNAREVILSGEGFFDIARDNEKPFILKTKNLSVKVMGTRFGVKAYEEDSQTILTLESGSVNALPHDKEKADNILFEANQLLTSDNQSKKIKHRLMDAEDYNTWKNGIILSPNQQLTLNNISGELQRINVEAYDYLSWKDGELYFRNATLEEIATVMERRFDIKIHIHSDDLKEEQYMARFKYGENPHVIFEKLSYKRSWRFIYNEGIYEIIKSN